MDLIHLAIVNYLISFCEDSLPNMNVLRILFIP